MNAPLAIASRSRTLTPAPLPVGEGSRLLPAPAGRRWRAAPGEGSVRALARRLAVALLVCAGTVHAEIAHWRIDPVHTQVLFSVDHLGFSKPVGRFTGVAGTLAFDPEAPRTVECAIAIDARTLSFGDAGWDAKVRSDAFLDAEQHPIIRFACERYEPASARSGRLFGTLTVRGRARPVALEVTINRIGRNSYSLKHIAGFSATATLRRSEFGLRRMLPAVGDELSVRIELEAIRARGAPR